jgi:hypothetical protein
MGPPGQNLRHGEKDDETDRDRVSLDDLFVSECARMFGRGLSAYILGAPDSVPDSLLQSRSLPLAYSIATCDCRHITVKRR